MTMRRQDYEQQGVFLHAEAFRHESAAKARLATLWGRQKSLDVTSAVFRVPARPEVGLHQHVIAVVAPDKDDPQQTRLLGRLLAGGMGQPTQLPDHVWEALIERALQYQSDLHKQRHKTGHLERHGVLMDLGPRPRWMVVADD
jgi:hypothetical protein